MNDTPERQPYGWAIEYPILGGKKMHVAVVVHDDKHDLAYAMQRAADLHGVIVPLFADRRK